nr:hypothetical protein Itr_chr09CG19000 [Ipomoea trifida]
MDACTHRKFSSIDFTPPIPLSIHQNAALNTKPSSSRFRCRLSHLSPPQPAPPAAAAPPPAIRTKAHPRRIDTTSKTSIPTFQEPPFRAPNPPSP